MEDFMSLDKNIAHPKFSEIENILKELTRLQKTSIDLFYDIQHTKQKVLSEKFTMDLEEKMYSGIKKIFK